MADNKSLRQAASSLHDQLISFNWFRMVGIESDCMLIVYVDRITKIVCNAVPPSYHGYSIRIKSMSSPKIIRFDGVVYKDEEDIY